MHSTWKMSMEMGIVRMHWPTLAISHSISLPCHINTAPNALHSRPTCLCERAVFVYIALIVIPDIFGIF